MNKWILFISLVFCPVFAGAMDVSCLPVKAVVRDKNILLSANSATLYFIKNTSTQGIWIDHPVDHPSASAGWSSYLRPGNWSALLLDRKNFALSCASIQPGNLSYLDCARVVAVCSPQKLQASSARKGTFWLIEDQPLNDFLKTLKLHSQPSRR